MDKVLGDQITRQMEGLCQVKESSHMEVQIFKKAEGNAGCYKSEV